VANLSGGTKQKLNLIISLLHRPALLILDEPYQGFDYESYLAFWDLVREFKEEGRSVLIVSHMLLDRDPLDRVYELREGRAVEEG
jgi:ABC-type multidrug transport system ATPase subunit